MWYLLYNVLLVLAAPFILLILLAKKRCRPGLAQRLGWFEGGPFGLLSLFGRKSLNRPDRPDRPVRPSILVNGRLSSQSFKGYGLVRPFIRRVLETVTFCMMQSERDAERIVALGAAPTRVLRTGNIKFDQPVPGRTGQQDGLSRGEINLAEHEELIVAGSTHP